MLAGLQKCIFSWLPTVIQGEISRQRPLGVNRFELTLYDGQTLTFDQPEKSRLLRKLFWRGVAGHEPQTMQTFYALARAARTVLDVGAFVGLYGLLAARANRTARIHCFEPFPENMALLNHFLELNQLDNVAAHQCAVSNELGSITFYVPESKDQRLPDIGSIKNRFESGRFADRAFRSLEVAAITLDEFCDREGIDQVDLMKIDVEECELQVLEGAQQMLARSKPDIICEVVFGNAQNRSIEKLLNSLGYRCFVMENGGLQKVEGLDSYTSDGRQTSKGGYSDRLLSTRSEAELRQLLAWQPRHRAQAA